eukprot:6409250-Amphidinium_carterae.1
MMTFISEDNEPKATLNAARSGNFRLDASKIEQLVPAHNGYATRHHHLELAGSGLRQARSSSWFQPTTAMPQAGGCIPCNWRKCRSTAASSLMAIRSRLPSWKRPWTTVIAQRSVSYYEALYDLRVVEAEKGLSLIHI